MNVVKLTILISLLSTTYGAQLFAQHRRLCRKHPIYCRITKLRPKINKKFAMRLSNLIYKASKKYHIAPEISVAILFQESRFKQEHTFKIKTTSSDVCTKTACVHTIIEKQKVFDLGIAQINVNTAVYYGFDLKRLYKHDMEYAIDCHFHILADKIKQCSDLGDYAWSCYHSATPQLRDKYIKLVDQYME